MNNRILWLTENYPPQRGGMAQSCDRIVHQMRKRGFLIDVLHFTNRKKGFEKSEQINGWHATVPFEESESHTLNLAWEFLRGNNFSLIVCFGGYLPMLCAPIFSKWLSAPLLTMIRGNDFDTGIFTPRKRDMVRDTLEASGIVCSVSKEKQWKIKSLYPSVNVCYIPNGIDCAEWKASASETQFAKRWRKENTHNKVCIGIFGQLKPKKGIQFLFDSLLHSEMLDKLHFLLIGEITDEVNELIRQHSISGSNIGFLDRYELLKYYLCCDAVAIPSFYDGMPNVLLEAGALGVPVIASCVDGMKDVIENKKNGLLFAPGDTSSCRKTFYDFLNMKADERRNLGEALGITINAEYNVEIEIKAYEKVCKELLDGNYPAIRMHVHGKP